MGFGNFIKKLNPLNLATSFVGGNVGSVLRVATTVVQGFATGRKFGDIMKDAMKQVAIIAVKAAVVYATGGTAGLFINTLIDKLSGVLGTSAAKVAANTILSPRVTEWIVSKMNGFGDKLTMETVQKEITDIVLRAANLKSTEEQLPLDMDQEAVKAELNYYLEQLINRHYTPTDLSQTNESLEGMYGDPVDEFIFE